jgi:hypothetical protein
MSERCAPSSCCCFVTSTLWPSSRSGRTVASTREKRASSASKRAPLLLVSLRAKGGGWQFGNFHGGFSGRMFVTLLGYPPKCERKGILHSCTLSFACWLVGGSSQEGCGASPWIVACCVTAKKSLNRKNELHRPQ